MKNNGGRINNLPTAPMIEKKRIIDVCWELQYHEYLRQRSICHIRQICRNLTDLNHPTGLNLRLPNSKECDQWRDVRGRQTILCKNFLQPSSFFFPPYYPFPFKQNKTSFTPSGILQNTQIFISNGINFVNDIPCV